MPQRLRVAGSATQFLSYRRRVPSGGAASESAHTSVSCTIGAISRSWKLDIEMLWHAVGFTDHMRAADNPIAAHDRVEELHGLETGVVRIESHPVITSERFAGVHETTYEIGCCSCAKPSQSCPSIRSARRASNSS